MDIVHWTLTSFGLEGALILFLEHISTKKIFILHTIGLYSIGSNRLSLYSSDYLII